MHDVTLLVMVDKENDRERSICAVTLESKLMVSSKTFLTCNLVGTMLRYLCGYLVY